MASATLNQEPVVVTDGVFFTAPAPLPRGRHGLRREQVLDAQRERLLAAATELLAAHGYRGFGPGEIATRAAVSLAAFYDCFTNKEACIFAGYDRFIEVLLARMTGIDLDGMDRAQITQALIDAYLNTLQSDLVVGRAYQVEIDALGPPARERRRNSLQLFANYIQEVTARTSPDGKPPEDLPPSAYIGVVYAVRQLASDALDREPEPDLVKLGEELRIWISDLLRQR
jgi:AcrR family transcriptional regulator